MIADAVARQYLLGQTNERERGAVEEEYFRHAASANRIAEIEEDLIEDYLAGRLGSDDRARFEQVYMASPAHRIRVEVFRGLIRPAQRPTVFARGWLALAAAAVIIVALGGLWLFLGPHETPRSIVQQPSAAPPANTPGTQQPADRQASAARIPPAVFAVSLSPLNVRGEGGIPTHIIPEATAIVILQLERESPGGPIQNGRIAIETMEGRAIWNGCAVSGDTGDVLARADVPAANLRRGDYIVRLSEKDAGGGDRERGRYFLRLR